MQRERYPGFTQNYLGSYRSCELEELIVKVGRACKSALSHDNVVEI